MASPKTGYSGVKPSASMNPVAAPKAPAAQAGSSRGMEPLIILGLIVVGALVCVNLFMMGASMREAKQEDADLKAGPKPIELAIKFEELRSELDKQKQQNLKMDLEVKRMKLIVAGLESQIGFVGSKVNEIVPQHGQHK